MNTSAMDIEHVEEINATVDHVWDLTMDVEAWPSITPTMTRLTRLDDEPLRLGSEVRIKQPGQRERVWTVSELEPRHRFSWSTRAMGVTMTGTHQLDPSDRGTCNTLTINLRGPLAPIMGTLLKRPLAKALAAENQGFKAAAER